MHYKTTIHHQCPSSLGGTRDRNNLLKLPEHIHVNFHRLFHNDDVKTQILRILTRFNPTCLTDEFRNDMMTILEESDQNYYYKNGILIPGNTK